MEAVTCALSVLVGIVIGAGVLARWWVNRLRDPEFSSKVIQGLHRQAGHAHFLSRSPEDPSRICPACGWEEQPRAPISPTERCGIRVVTAHWAVQDGGDGDLVGTKAELEAVVEDWCSEDAEQAQEDAGVSVLYEIRPYTGVSPVRPEVMREFFARERKLLS